VTVTGAQPFDRWFEQSPRPRQVICEKAGLSPDKPYLIFLGSTQSISRPETERDFVLRWIKALRESDDPELRDVGVMIRPHPYNAELWSETDVSGLGDVGIWPKIGANPVLASDRADYYDSLHHAAAAIGINTSAMIEAAIAGTPVFTIKASEFVETQTGTIHFGYLLREHGGPAQAADSIDEHVQQLLDAQVVSGDQAAAASVQDFVSSFIRPNGLDHACVPLVAEAIERAAALDRGKRRAPLWVLPFRGCLWAVGMALLLTDPKRLSASPETLDVVDATSRAAAPLIKRALRSTEPGRTPYGEYLRTQRPEVVTWLRAAVRRQPESTGRIILKRWVDRQRAGDPSDAPEESPSPSQEPVA
jgi:hypothetical protein